MIIAIGVIGLRRTRTFGDFFLAGGKVGPWLTAFSYGAAYFSAVLFIGFAGKVGWSFGYSGLWIALGNALVGVLAVWWLLGPKVKDMSNQLGIATMSEYFEKRYHSKFLKVFSSVVVFVFFIPYSAAVFIGLSYLFKANFNMKYVLALVFMGVFTAVYLVLGGYKSMTMVDIVFGIIMVTGAVILSLYTIDRGGGLSGVSASLSAIQPGLIKAVGPPGLWPLFCLVFITSVAPWGMPQLVQKFYAIKDKQSIRTGMIASTLFALVFTSAAYFIGASTRVFLTPGKNPSAFVDGRPVFDALIPELIARVIPASLSIFILLLILSASMSTLAAVVLISGSSLTKDLYSGFINRSASEKRLTLLMRLSTGFFILLSVILAYFKPATIVAIMSLTLGAVGSVFLGPFVWGLFWKRTNKIGAISSSLLGFLTCLVLYLTGMSPPEASCIGMIVSLVVAPVMSLLTPAAGESI
jgi:SSS family solute:Na+ symporter/sodium/proline symporter